MFLCNVHQRLLLSPNIFQKLSNKDFISQNLKRHVMILLHFQINNCIQKSSNGFFKTVSSNYLKPSFLFYKIKYSKLSDEKCRNCQQHVEFKEFVCPLCGALQHPKENINYFELFGIYQTFDIDLEDLSAKFRNLQMTFHPDKFANKSKEDLETSESHSRLINKAYTTLKNPLGRGFYLLQLRKLSVNDSISVEKEFLMSIMNKNEELDYITDKNVLKEFFKKNNEEVQKQIHLVSESFRRENYIEARLNLLKLNYFLNLEMKIKEKENDLLHRG